PDSIGSRVRQAAEYDKIALMQSNAFKLVREGGTGQHCTAARGIHAELPGFVRPSEEPRDSGRWCALRKPCGREQKSGKGQRTSFHGLSKPTVGYLMSLRQRGKPRFRPESGGQDLTSPNHQDSESLPCLPALKWPQNISPSALMPV